MARYCDRRSVTITKRIDSKVLENLCWAVVLSQRFQPNWIIKTDLLETYCNMAVKLIAEVYGCHLTGMANQITKFIEQSCEWKKVDFREAHELAREGCLVVTAKTALLHGHVAVIFPSEKMGKSGKWDCEVPIVANVGNCNKIVGLNWVFRDKPSIYVYAPSTPISQDDLGTMVSTEVPGRMSSLC